MKATSKTKATSKSKTKAKTMTKTTAITKKPDPKDAINRHVVAVVVDNEPGVLARVIGLFSGRGYNIESLTVSSINTSNTVSRITLVVTGTDMIIQQIKAQLGRLVPVRSVTDLTLTPGHVEKEVVLVKYIGKGKKREEALRIANVFRATVIDTTLGSFVLSLTGSSGKLDSFVQLIRELGTAEISRSGVVALERGSNYIQTKTKE